MKLGTLIKIGRVVFWLNIANVALNFWCGNYPLAVLGVSCAALIGLVTRSSEKLVKGE